MKKIFADLDYAVELEASEKFPTLVDRVVENRGSLDLFIEENHEQ